MKAPAATRASFTITVEMGLVQVPMKAYKLTEELRLPRKMVTREENHPIGLVKVDKTTGEVVSDSDVVKVVELGDGRLVELSDEEIQAAAGTTPGVNTSVLGIRPAVEVADSGPIEIYALRPSGPTTAKAFALLMAGLQDRNWCILIRLINGGNERLGYIDQHQRLRIVRWTEEMREEPKPAPQITVSSEEVDMAATVISQMALQTGQTKVQPVLVSRVLSYAEDKAGDGVEPPQDSAQFAGDLMELLKLSVEANKLT